jgi:hypothetical protein
MRKAESLTIGAIRCVRDYVQDFREDGLAVNKAAESLMTLQARKG